MYFKCTCGVGSSIKLKYDWLMCSGLTFRENTKCFLNTLQNHFDDPYSLFRLRVVVVIRAKLQYIAETVL